MSKRNCKNFTGLVSKTNKLFEKYQVSVAKGINLYSILTLCPVRRIQQNCYSGSSPPD